MTHTWKGTPQSFLVVVAFMAKWKPASLYVYLFGVFVVVFYKRLKSYIRQMKWNEIQMFQSPKGPIVKTTFKKRAEKNSLAGCEFEKCSTPRINSGAIWKSYLAPTCFSWGKQREKKRWLSLISWASLTPAGSYNICCCLKPLEQGWHSSTLSSFHWLSQQLPIKRFRT